MYFGSYVNCLLLFLILAKHKFCQIFVKTHKTKIYVHRPLGFMLIQAKVPFKQKTKTTLLV